MLTCSAIHILFHGASSQTKISYFDKFLFADQDIASGEISMNNILSWQILLWIETSIITVDAYYPSVLKSIGDKLIRVQAPGGDSLTKAIRRGYSWEISSLHDPVTWYEINYASTQITQWDLQNKGTLTSPARLYFVLNVLLRYLRPSIIYSVPWDRIMQRAN